jgi:hypothetical protein
MQLKPVQQPELQLSNSGYSVDVIYLVVELQIVPLLSPVD